MERKGLYFAALIVFSASFNFNVKVKGAFLQENNNTQTPLIEEFLEIKETTPSQFSTTSIRYYFQQYSNTGYSQSNIFYSNPIKSNQILERLYSINLYQDT